MLICIIVVPVPTDFGLPYQDVELLTPDEVKLRCYLLVQRKDLLHIGAEPFEGTEEETDEEVSSRLHASGACKRRGPSGQHGSGQSVSRTASCPGHCA